MSTDSWDYAQYEDEITVAHNQNGMIYVTCGTCKGAQRNVSSCGGCLGSGVSLVPCRCSECKQARTYAPASAATRSDPKPPARKGGGTGSGKHPRPDPSSNSVSTRRK